MFLKQPLTEANGWMENKHGLQDKQVNLRTGNSVTRLFSELLLLLLLLAWLTTQLMLAVLLADWCQEPNPTRKSPIAFPVVSLLSDVVLGLVWVMFENFL